jgi:lipopolysaccharide export system permease protein
VKILDRYILTSFLSTFATVFVILFFIFILQGIWLFIADLAGKDLDSYLIIKFLAFYSPKVVPLVLPLSVLLASIMTFGNFAENYEFAAMKSSGISLRRAMHSLAIFILGLSFVAFLFANNIIPQAEYKFINLRKSIVQQKPSMAIAEGQFSNVGNYTIKVAEKYGDNDNLLRDVTIHKLSNLGVGTTVVIKAKRGELISNENSNFLQLILFDGNYYEDVPVKNFEEKNKVPFAKSAFKKYIINFDLAPLQKTDMDADQIANTNNMLNVNELRYTLDSLENNHKKDVVSYTENMKQRYVAFYSKQEKNVQKDTITKEKAIQKDTIKDLISLVQPHQIKNVYDIAKANASNTKFSIEGSKYELEGKIKNINNHWLALYDKFVIAYACLLMFFIGAPIGAIIRKGGLGLPIVFAMVIFIVYHFINVFGKKLAQEDGITPFLGAWMSSILLTPFAILLTYRATNDIGLVNMDVILQPFFKLFKKNTQPIDFKKEIIDLDKINIDHKEDEFLKFNKMSDSILIGIVKNSDQFGYTALQRLKLLKILESRGITQKELLYSNNLYNSEYLKLTHCVSTYKKQSKIALLLFVFSTVFSVVSNSMNIVLIILGLLNSILMYVYIYKSGQTLSEISKLTNRQGFVNIYLAIILGFPFFVLIYFFNRKQLKETLEEFNKK